MAVKRGEKLHLVFRKRIWDGLVSLFLLLMRIIFMQLWKVVTEKVAFIVRLTKVKIGPNKAISARAVTITKKSFATLTTKTKCLQWTLTCTTRKMEERRSNQLAKQTSMLTITAFGLILQIPIIG